MPNLRQSVRYQNRTENGSVDTNSNLKKSQPLNSSVSFQKKNSAVKEKEKGNKKPMTTIPNFQQPTKEDLSISMISNISAAEIVKQSEEFEKWDILFNNIDWFLFNIFYYCSDTNVYLLTKKFWSYQLFAQFYDFTFFANNLSFNEFSKDASSTIWKI